MKLENIKTRLLNGEQVKNTKIEQGTYFIQFTNGPEITFDEQYKPTVDNTIRKAANGIHERTEGNSTVIS